MDLATKVLLIRSRASDLATGVFPPSLGNPIPRGSGESLPEGLRALYEVFDELSTELVSIQRYGKVAQAFAEGPEDSDLFNPAPNMVEFGHVYHGSSLRIDKADGSIHLLREDMYMEAIESFELTETELLAPEPIAFAEAFLFGSRYPELIELAGGYLNPGARERDSWRHVLLGLGLLL